MGKGKNWTAADIEYVEANWGTRSIPAIAQALGRSVNAVKEIAHRHGLTRWIHNGEFITLNQLMIALGRGPVHHVSRDLFLRNGFPIHYKAAIKKKVAIVYPHEFWKWAEQHKDLIDLSRVELLSLGVEPPWAVEKRKADQLAKPYTGRDWTQREDALLKGMLRQQRYGYTELSQALQRTESAIKRRILTLKLKERPVPVNDKPWTAEETQTMLAMIGQGYGFEVIAQRLGRSALAVRGKHERLQRPDYFVRYYRRQREQLKLKDCFQKDVCQHYIPSAGCTKNGTNCDTCLEFKRKLAEAN